MIHDYSSNIHNIYSVGVKIQGETIKVIRFAGDTAIVAETKANIKHIMQRMEEIMGNENEGYSS